MCSDPKIEPSRIWLWKTASHQRFSLMAHLWGTLNKSFWQLPKCKCRKKWHMYKKVAVSRGQLTGKTDGLECLWILTCTMKIYQCYTVVTVHLAWSVHTAIQLPLFYTTITAIIIQLEERRLDFGKGKGRCVRICETRT